MGPRATGRWTENWNTPHSEPHVNNIHKRWSTETRKHKRRYVKERWASRGFINQQQWWEDKFISSGPGGIRWKQRKTNRVKKGGERRERVTTLKRGVRLLKKLWCSLQVLFRLNKRCWSNTVACQAFTLCSYLAHPTVLVLFYKMQLTLWEATSYYLIQSF